MLSSLLKNSFYFVLLAGCTSTSHNNVQQTVPAGETLYTTSQPEIADTVKLRSMMELPQTQYGGFVLQPGFYEAEFKTYCLQPGTPDPHSGDAYFQGAVSGNNKEIVETALINSTTHTEIPQRNIQLLLWSVVSGADFNRLSYSVQSDAAKLLTPKQIFKLKGGVAGAIRTISYNTGLFSTNSSMQRLFETGISSYEAFEKLAVLKEPSQVRFKNAKPDQWYRQPDNYYIRYYPLSYQKVRIQLFVPANLADSSGKVAGEYLVFDPTGKQAIPAFTNAQRLGVGAPVLEVMREIIRINKPLPPVSRPSGKQKQPAPSPKQAGTPNLL